MSQEIAPNITVKPRLRQVDNGNRLLIECEIEASPKPEIKWFKWNFHLNETERVQLNMTEVGINRYAVTLALDGITSDDSGI